MDLSETNLTSLERQLLHWRPAPTTLDRDRLLFEAGVAAERGRNRWVVQHAITATLMLISVGLGFALFNAQTDRMALRKELAARPSIDDSSRSPSVHRFDSVYEETSDAIVQVARTTPHPDSYLAMTRRLLASGSINSSHATPAIEGSPRVSEPALTPLGIRTLRY